MMTRYGVYVTKLCHFLVIAGDFLSALNVVLWISGDLYSSVGKKNCVSRPESP